MAITVYATRMQEIDWHVLIAHAGGLTPCKRNTLQKQTQVSSKTTQVMRIWFACVWLCVCTCVSNHDRTNDSGPTHQLILQCISDAATCCDAFMHLSALLSKRGPNTQQALKPRLTNRSLMHEALALDPNAPDPTYNAEVPPPSSLYVSDRTWAISLWDCLVDIGPVCPACRDNLGWLPLFDHGKERAVQAYNSR